MAFRYCHEATATKRVESSVIILAMNEIGDVRNWNHVCFLSLVPVAFSIPFRGTFVTMSESE
jgi:hypothetical protein